ncbi:MAG: hypothetical protein WC548_03030 [Candidatus Pacearchaeota archaeon]
MKLKTVFIVLILVNFFFVVYSFSITGKATSGNVNISIEDGSRIVIHSPLNETYNFEPGEYPIDLNVSSNIAYTEWRYSLYDLRHGTTPVSEFSFTPNSSLNASRWENKLKVQARTATGNWASKEVIFYVNVSNTAPVIGDIDDEIFSCEGTVLEYFFNGSDVDEDTLLSDISPKNPFYTSFLGKSGNYISLFKIFSGTLNKNHIGTRTEMVSVNDFYSDSCCVDSTTTNITVIEINNPPRLSGIGAQTVWVTGDDSNFYHQMDANDIEDGNSFDGRLRFNISFLNDEDLFSIDNYYGIMDYNPLPSHIGVYSVRVCVEDRGISFVHENISLCFPRGNWRESACDDFTITVTDENRPPEITYYVPSGNFSSEGTNISSFYVETYDPDGTIPDIDWYVDNQLKEHNENMSFDNFSYIFGCDVSGNHTIKIIATDGLLNATHEWNISVRIVACAPEASTGGGGGGGGGVSKYCFESWVCPDWEVCQNLEKSFDINGISEEDYYYSKEICAQEKYNISSCGFQIRACSDINNCTNPIFKIPKPFEYQICHYTENPNCNDKIKNCHDGRCELLVDCGGPCGPCPTCSDKIRNQGELGVDCGGPCPFKCETEFPFQFNWLFIILIIVLIIVLIFIILKIRNIYKYKAPLSKEEKRSRY